MGRKRGIVFYLLIAIDALLGFRPFPQIAKKMRYLIIERKKKSDRCECLTEMMKNIWGGIKERRLSFRASPVSSSWALSRPI